jgi:hypothetical protein
LPFDAGAAALALLLSAFEFALLASPAAAAGVEMSLPALADTPSFFFARSSLRARHA